MASSTSSSSEASNTMDGGKHIQFGPVNFVPHPLTHLHAYANLEKAMEMMFGSFLFLVGREGSHRFSALIFLGPLAVEPDQSGSSASSVESDDEEVSPSRFTKPADSGKLADLFGGMTFGSQKPIYTKIASSGASPTSTSPTHSNPPIVERSSPIYTTVSPILSSTIVPLQHIIRSVCSQHRVARWKKMSNLRHSIHWATPSSIP
jgi:hypothetical protein